MWYWTVNTPIRPPSELPTPLSWPPSIIHTTVRKQYFNQNTTNKWKCSDLDSSDTINSDSGWRVDEEKGGMTWRNKNGGETEQKGPLFPSRTFSPWPHRWWWWRWWFCSNNRNTIKIKTEINLMIGGNAIKSKRASETNVREDPFQWYLWSHGSKLNTS